MFLVGCAQEEVSEAELEAELGQLSAGELDQAIEKVEAEDTGALAGQAYFDETNNKVSKDKFLKVAYRMKATEPDQCCDITFNAAGYGTVDEGFTCEASCLDKGYSGCVFRVAYTEHYESVETLVPCDLPVAEDNTPTKCICTG